MGRNAPATGKALAYLGALTASLGFLLGCGGYRGDVRTAPDLLSLVTNEDGTPRVDSPVPVWKVQVVERRGHDPSAFTQGLEFHEGRLYESRGLYGQSALTEVDPKTGRVLRYLALDPAVFAEGLTVVDDRIIVLTWREGRALVVDRHELRVLEEFAYDGEGWGLCHDGSSLVMSDGSNILEFRDPATFAVRRTVHVTVGGEPVGMLNELECVDDRVFANVWQQDALVVVDPSSGVVEGVVDARGLLSETGKADSDVLNGIAHDEGTDNLLLTGKKWSASFLVRISPDLP